MSLTWLQTSEDQFSHDVVHMYPVIVHVRFWLLGLQTRKISTETNVPVILSFLKIGLLQNFPGEGGGYLYMKVVYMCRLGF